MHAANASRREHTNTGVVRHDHGPGNRRRCILAPRHRDRQVAPAALTHAAERTRREALDFNGRHTDGNDATQYSDCRGNGPGLAHRPLHCECSFGIRRPRQAVCDQRRLERDNWNLRLKSVGNLMR
jgi:hypothetical protein